MKASAAKIVLFVLIIVLSGCAGANFVRIPDDALVLGQTTPEQVYSRLGSPHREGFVTTNNQQIKYASYSYSAMPFLPTGVWSQRSQGFCFFDNKLVCYEFVSSCEEDSTNFDSSKVSEIKKGESTRSDVVRLLGNPSGKFIYPTVTNNDEEAILYKYKETKGPLANPKIYEKRLWVIFDKQGVVKNFQFTEAGSQ